MSEKFLWFTMQNETRSHLIVTIIIAFWSQHLIVFSFLGCLFFLKEKACVTALLIRTKKSIQSGEMQVKESTRLPPSPELHRNKVPESEFVCCVCCRGEALA